MNVDAPVCAAMLLRGRWNFEAAIAHAVTLERAEQRRWLYEVARVIAPADMLALWSRFSREDLAEPWELARPPSIALIARALALGAVDVADSLTAAASLDGKIAHAWHCAGAASARVAALARAALTAQRERSLRLRRGSVELLSERVSLTLALPKDEAARVLLALPEDLTGAAPLVVETANPAVRASPRAHAQALRDVCLGVTNSFGSGPYVEYEFFNPDHGRSGSAFSQLVEALCAAGLDTVAVALFELAADEPIVVDEPAAWHFLDQAAVLAALDRAFTAAQREAIEQRVLAQAKQQANKHAPTWLQLSKSLSERGRERCFEEILRCDDASASELPTEHRARVLARDFAAFDEAIEVTPTFEIAYRDHAIVRALARLPSDDARVVSFVDSRFERAYPLVAMVPAADGWSRGSASLLAWVLDAARSGSAVAIARLARCTSEGVAFWRESAFYRGLPTDIVDAAIDASQR